MNIVYADQIFIQNCNDILEHGVWDTDYDVRPVWEGRHPITPSSALAS